MIPRDYITEWRDRAPWVEDYQVEQDLVISRALVDIFGHRDLREALCFRGGTALYKLHINPPARYSEDIDLVQVRAEPIGPTLDALRSVLEPWLGTPQWKQNEGRVTLNYRFNSEDTPPLRLRLKVEINSREHFSLFGHTEMPFEMASRWYSGSARIGTYDLDELLGTKLRALYQRRKGRDLFDLAVALDEKTVNPSRVIEAFKGYMERTGEPVTRAMFEQNLTEKLNSNQFTADIGPLLSGKYSWDFDQAATAVWKQLIARLPGEPWKGSPDSQT